MKYRNLVVNLTNTKRIKEVVGTYSNNYWNALVIKSFQFSTKYKKYAFNRTIVNSWKAKCKNINAVFKEAGKPNLLDENLIRKVKDILIPLKAARKVIRRKSSISLVLKHDIQSSLVINLDQTPLSYIYQGKYTFSFKGAKNVSIR